MHVATVFKSAVPAPLPTVSTRVTSAKHTPLSLTMEALVEHWPSDCHAGV